MEAFRDGIWAYLSIFKNESALYSIRLTLLVCVIAVPCNMVFGIMASWAIAKFDFRGKKLLITCIDIPFSVSPVISGLVYVLLLGANSKIGHLLEQHNIQIIFATPALVLVTMFVTFPFVARELIPLMEDQGNQEEEAAIMLGANGWQTFWHITLPNIRWGLFYGVLLCNARAMGEFGAVSVVSGHIQNVTSTIPLQVEMFYNDYNTVAAFSLASLLTILALLTLMIKLAMERREESKSMRV